MSFLKKHWRFTVPAVVVLCVLLLGVVALYSTGEAPEPTTVYVMPERNPDNPPAVNTGGLPPPPAAGPINDADAVESIEFCCDEELALIDDYASDESTAFIPDKSLDAELPYSSGDESNPDTPYRERMAAMLAQAEESAEAQWIDEMLVSLVAYLDPEFQQMVRERMAQDMSTDEIDAFFAKVTNATPITPEQFMREYDWR